MIPLVEVRDRDAFDIGPKAAGVARMVRLGLPVPPGFCVIGAAYREHLKRTGLASRIKRELAGLPDRIADRNALLSRIRSDIVEAPVPDELADALADHVRVLGGGALAVRSSATEEDLPDRSFAGQYDTVLGVVGADACLSAVKRCWASLWTERAFAYRSDHGLEHLDVDMAVLIQQLVPAESSGVLFTVDPTRRAPDRIVIDGGFGLGEAVVSGRISPDRFVLSRSDLDVTERAIGTKPFAVRPLAHGGVSEDALDPEKAGEPCLDDATARRLGELALRAESALGFPLDLEWALAGGTLYLLQARPITTRPAGDWDDRQVWTNANSGEVLPDVMTPMTESALTPLCRRLFGTMGDWLGANLWDATLFAVIAGRVYFNLNTFAGFLRRIPVVRHRSLAELLGGRQDVAAGLGQIRIRPEDTPDLEVSWSKAIIRLPRVVVSFVLHSPKRGNRYLAAVSVDTETLWKTPWRSLPDLAMVQRAREIIDSLGNTDGFVLLGVSVSYTLMLFNVCRRWFGASGDAVASRLLSGLGSLDTAEAGLELRRLAELAHEHAEIERAVSAEKGFDLLERRLKETDGGRAFLERWDAFMWRHGHHTRGEVELFNARWSEQPDYVLGLLRSSLGAIGQTDPLARAKTLAEEREALAASCRAKLRNPIRRIAFRFILKQAQLAAPIRENLKSEAIRRATLIRFMLLELGRRMVDRGVIEAPDDVFFLGLDELERALADQEAAEVRPTVADRRAAHEKNMKIIPPSIIIGRFDPDDFEPDPVDESAEVLSGIAVSPGAVTGTARVLQRAGDDQVRPGEILVAPFTDPGWTPYFLNAAAIVMDLGGLLSHGAIVAREYGIPCVVNVGSATKIIETGQEIRVDGDRGTVTILRDHR